MGTSFLSDALILQEFDWYPHKMEQQYQIIAHASPHNKAYEESL